MACHRNLSAFSPTSEPSTACVVAFIRTSHELVAETYSSASVGRDTGALERRVLELKSPDLLRCHIKYRS